MTQTRIGRAQIDGQADVAVDQGRARWKVDVHGQEVQLRCRAREPTSRRWTAVKQAGEFEQTARKLRLDWLNVQVFERSRFVVTLSLDQPLTLNLEQGVDGFTVLPVAVTVGGTTENPTYGVNTMASRMVGRHAAALIGTVADLFTACRGGEAAQKATEEVLRSAQKTVDDLIKDLFVGKEKR